MATEDDITVLVVAHRLWHEGYTRRGESPC